MAYKTSQFGKKQNKKKKLLSLAQISYSTLFPGSTPPVPLKIQFLFATHSLTLASLSVLSQFFQRVVSFAPITGRVLIPSRAISINTVPKEPSPKFSGMELLSVLCTCTLLPYYLCVLQHEAHYIVTL